MEATRTSGLGSAELAKASPSARRWVSAVSSAAVTAALLVAVAAEPAAAADCNGAVLTGSGSCTVPATGVTVVKVVAIGGGGGGGYKTGSSGAGAGGGAAVIQILQPVAPNDALSYVTATGGVGGGFGIGGGGGSGAAAGGATAVVAAKALGGGGGGSTRVDLGSETIVAGGGGGGAGNANNGGASSVAGGNGAQGGSLAGGNGGATNNYSGKGGHDGVGGLLGSSVSFVVVQTVGSSVVSPSVDGAGGTGGTNAAAATGGGGGGGYGGGAGAGSAAAGGGGGAGGSKISANGIPLSYAPATTGSPGGGGPAGATVGSAGTSGGSGQVTITPLASPAVTVRVYGDPTSTGQPVTGGHTLGTDPAYMAPYSGLVAANGVAVQVIPTCSGVDGATFEATAGVTSGDYSVPSVYCADGTDVQSYRVQVQVAAGSCLVAGGLAPGLYPVGMAQYAIPTYGTNLPDGSTPAYRATLGASPAQAFTATTFTAGVYLPAVRACAQTTNPSTAAAGTAGGALPVTNSTPPSNGGAALFAVADILGVNGYNRVLAKPLGSPGAPGGGYRDTYSRCGVTNASPTTVDCQLGGPGGVAVTGGLSGFWNPAGCASQIIRLRGRFMTQMGYGLWSPEGSAVLAGPCS